MPTSRSRKRKSKREPRPTPHQEATRPQTSRRILVGWWRGLLAGIGLVAALIALSAEYDQRYPDVRPSSDSSAPTEFLVQNNSLIFAMSDMGLVCDVESAAFETDRGRIGFSFPVTSGAVNTAIPARSAAHYPCDASNFLRFSNGKLCLIGLCNDHTGISPASVRLAGETLKIWMSYRIWGFSVEHKSEMFTWDGHQWQRGPALR
jgi:hypothetical protein